MKTSSLVFKHEVKKILSDRKLIVSMLIMPFMVMLMMSFISAPNHQNTEDAFNVYALNNALSMKQGKLQIIPVDYSTLAQLKENVDLKPSDVILNISGEFVTIYYNSVDGTSSAASRVCEGLLIDSALYSFAKANRVDVSSMVSFNDVNDAMNMENQTIAAMLPYMLILMLFQNTSNYTIDSIAGEKERGVFAKALLTPVRPVGVIAGKILAGTLYGVVSCTVYVAIMIALPYITGQDVFGIMEANIKVEMCWLIFACMLFLCYFTSNLATLYSLISKNIKEAQSFSMMCYGVVAVMALLTLFRVGSVHIAQYSIPVYNICILAQDVLYSSVEVEKALVTTCSLGVYSLVISGITFMLFKRENIEY